jgi:hypothetical protein
MPANIRSNSPFVRPSRLHRVQGILSFIADQMLQFWPPYREERDDDEEAHSSVRSLRQLASRRQHGHGMR